MARKAVIDPTADEIRQLCETIQATWSTIERERRATQCQASIRDIRKNGRYQIPTGVSPCWQGPLGAFLWTSTQGGRTVRYQGGGSRSPWGALESQGGPRPTAFAIGTSARISHYV